MLAQTRSRGIRSPSVVILKGVYQVYRSQAMYHVNNNSVTGVSHTDVLFAHAMTFLIGLSGFLCGITLSQPFEKSRFPGVPSGNSNGIVSIPRLVTSCEMTPPCHLYSV